MRSTRSRLAVAAVLPLMLLSACGGESDKASSSSSSSASPLTVATEQVSSIKAAQVSTTDPKKPTVKLAKTPFRVNATTVDVTKPGTGKTVGNKDIAYVSYVAVNGTSGKTIESTFGKPNAAFNLGNAGTFPGLVKALKGKKVGTEMTVAVPPAEGFGASGNKQVGVTSKDTMVFFVKVNDTMPLLKQAQGKAVNPPKDLPKVELAKKDYAQAKITIPKGAKAPTKLVAQDLIEGEGPKVVAGQTILASYTGVTWPDGKVFDATAKTGQPAPFGIGQGQVIKAWDQGLVGKRVGSRVLIVAPASLAYGKEGMKDQAGKQTIAPNTPLVFAVDILAAV